MKTLTSSRSLVGGDVNPKNLHSFGDRDGVQTDAKLQHPLGVHFIPEKYVILVTDTYNHKVKVVDPFRNEIFSWLGGAHTNRDSLVDGVTGSSAFNEPQGVSSLFDEVSQDVKVYICDTNNHCIRTCYYDIGQVTTLEIKGIPTVNQDLYEKDQVVDISAKKRESKTIDNGDQTDMRCEDGNCYPVFE